MAQKEGRTQGTAWLEETQETARTGHGPGTSFSLWMIMLMAYEYRVVVGGGEGEDAFFVVTGTNGTVALISRRTW